MAEKLRYCLLLAGLLLAGLLLVGCSNPEIEPGLLRVGLAQMPISLDPRFATDAASSRVQEFVHRGLLRLDEAFNIQGDLADRWEQPEPLVWRFYLRQGISFSDGAPVTAADVAATLNAVLDPALASPLKASFEAIDSVAAEGERVVVIRLGRPDASLLSRLNIGVLPARLAAAGHEARRTIGCGPYRLESWQENRLELVRLGGKGRDSGPSIIRFIAVKDPVTRVLKISRGELDFVQNDLPPQLLSYLQEQEQLSMQTRPSTTFSYIGLNLQDQLLGNVAVRRALALAVDRDKLKKALFADLPDLAETVLTRAHWAASELPELAHDAGEAERLLDAAGYKRGSDGIRFELNYRTSTDPVRLRLATAVADMWGRIGVRVSVESLEWGGFYARIKSGDFQVFSLAWVGITDPDIYRSILHSSMWPPKGANRGRYADAEMDEWLDRAAATTGLEERKALYARVEAQMHRDMVYIPLWYEPVVAVSGPRLSGFVPRADGSLLGLLQAELAGE